MSTTGDKYKLKITNIGVGDPFLLIKAQFQDSGSPPDGGSWTLPSENPISGFVLNVGLSADQQSEPSAFTPVGSIHVNNFDTANFYFFGLPFDQNGIDAGNTLWLCLSAQDANGNAIYIYGDNQYSDHSYYIQSLNRLDQAVDFSNIMVYYNWADS